MSEERGKYHKSVSQRAGLPVRDIFGFAAICINSLINIFMPFQYNIYVVPLLQF